MSDREKKLIVFFAIAGFVILNLLAFNFAKSMRIDVDSQAKLARAKLATAERFQQQREQVTSEMEWLAEHEPQPAADQDVQTSLQKAVESEAKSVGLTIKMGQQPILTDTSGKNYHRAKIKISVTGTELALYSWFDRLNVPDQFRIDSQILLTPNVSDDTKIDCVSTFEQWFVPTAP
jgi:hypothetical protein